MYPVIFNAIERLRQDIDAGQTRCPDLVTHIEHRRFDFCLS
ncbi:hypothetical protein [Mesorhizobium sp.]|nr:hypothetical protein [Mesorhizobium sp.]